MRAHTETRHQQKHGAKQLMETTGIVMKDAQEFKIQFFLEIGEGFTKPILI